MTDFILLITEILEPSKLISTELSCSSSFPLTFGPVYQYFGSGGVMHCLYHLLLEGRLSMSSVFRWDETDSFDSWRYISLGFHLKHNFEGFPKAMLGPGLRLAAGSFECLLVQSTLCFEDFRLQSSYQNTYACLWPHPPSLWFCPLDPWRAGQIQIQLSGWKGFPTPNTEVDFTSMFKILKYSDDKQGGCKPKHRRYEMSFTGLHGTWFF